MTQTIGNVTLLVRDYDEALDYYVGVLGFVPLEDKVLSDEKRWVVVAPRGSGTSLVLAKAAVAEQSAQVGNQAGGRVFLFLHSDDFERDYATMQARGVAFQEAPRREAYGIVAVFTDLYGNRWDLLQLERRVPD